MLKAAPVVPAGALAAAVLIVAVPDTAAAEAARRGYVRGVFMLDPGRVSSQCKNKVQACTDRLKSAPQQGKRVVVPQGSVTFVDHGPLPGATQGSSNGVQKIRTVPSRGTHRATLKGNKTLTVGGSRTENR